MGKRNRGALLLALLTALHGLHGFVGQAPGHSDRLRSVHLEATLDEVPTSLSVRQKIPVVLCPAQFGTAEDYDELKVNLEARGFVLYPAPLSRLDWLRIVPSTLTKEFFTAELRPKKTLGFFYEALDQALAQVDAEFGPEEPVAFLGHSIGGWVARSYIGEVLGPDVAQQRVRSLVTLGTPHQPPPEDSPVAILDQTRGLLTYINEKFPAGYPLNSSVVTCVAGCGTKTPPSMDEMMDGLGEKVWNQTQNRSTLLEEVVALASYLPLSGSTFGVEGDGLIPVDTALMEGCGSVVLDDCNHADFVPTPGESIRLPKSYQWYGSDGFLVTLLMFRRQVPCRRWIALSACLWLACFGGLWAGDQNYGHHMISFYTYQDLVSYTDLDPAVAKGQSFMDSGEVYFKEGTTVDTNEMVSFRNRLNFCAAPILGQPLRNQKGLHEVAREGDFVMPESGTVDFWAVGTNCCDKATREFTCGEASNKRARAGMRMIREDHRPFYLLAIQEWTARMCPTSGEDNTAKGHSKAAPLLCIPSRHPLLFTWVEDPVGEVTKYYEQALWRFEMDVVVFLMMDIFIALGALLGLKELGFK